MSEAAVAEAGVRSVAAARQPPCYAEVFQRRSHGRDMSCVNWVTTLFARCRGVRSLVSTSPETVAILDLDTALSQGDVPAPLQRP
jgi:hypothetical protein